MKNKKWIVEETGFCKKYYLGNIGYNGINGVKSWDKYLKRNGLDCQYGVGHRENGWYLFRYPCC